MKLETSIMSQTSVIAGPYEHYLPVNSPADVLRLAEHRLTGEGAGHALYPQSAAEEAVLAGMVSAETAVACGYADGLPGYYQVLRG